MSHHDDAVTPVIGTVLILLITMAGIGAVLAWGVPSVVGIQDQSSLSAMKGEFSDVRLNTLVLKETDTSRLPDVALSAGSLALEPGGRFVIHAVHNDTFPDGLTTSDPDCDIRVTGWTSTSDTLVVAVDSCGNVEPEEDRTMLADNELGFQLDQILGSTIQSRPGISITDDGGGIFDVNSAGDELSEGNWRLRLMDSSGAPHAQAFILGTDRLAWHLESSVSDMDLYIEGGALWHTDSPQVFNLAPLPVNEDVFGSSDYLLHFVTYSGDYIEIGSPASPDVFLKLLGNHGRVSGLDTFSIRYDFSGELAEAWCNHLLFRNADITAGAYSEDVAATCELGDGDGTRSVTYEPTGGGDFPFEFIHKRVHAGVTV